MAGFLYFEQNVAADLYRNLSCVFVISHHSSFDSSAWGEAKKCNDDEPSSAHKAFSALAHCTAQAETERRERKTKKK